MNVSELAEQAIPIISRLEALRLHEYCTMSDLNTPLVKKRKWSWVDWAVQFRWILVITVVLPVSMAFDIWAEWGDWWSARKSEEKRQKEHDKHVEEVIKRLKVRNYLSLSHCRRGYLWSMLVNRNPTMSDKSSSSVSVHVL